MGDFLRVFDFNQGEMARKFLAPHRHVDGLEAPRNSLDLQPEAAQNYHAAGDDLYYYQVEDDWSRATRFAAETSMKNLINEEISIRSNTRKNTPSIVARLMGIDVLPLDMKSAAPPIDKKKNTTRLMGIDVLPLDMKSATPPIDKKKNTTETKHQKVKKGRISTTHSSSKSASGQVKFDELYPIEKRDADGWSDDHITRPRRREHPQEEELQKFKKEFEAWQASRFNECSKFVDLTSNSRLLPAAEITNEQTAVQNASSEIAGSEESGEYCGLTFKKKSYANASLQLLKDKVERFPSEHKSISSSNKTVIRNIKPSPCVSNDKKVNKSSFPTRIVILKPGPDTFFDHERSWTGSLSTLEDRGSIEDFLEEVKERLKCELQGKALKRGSILRGSGIETPFSEKPPDPKRIAHHIAKQVRDSVTQDLGLNLLRSESTRSYRSDIHLDGASTPEFINRGSRRFLSEKLRNVLRRETHLEVPTVANDNARSSFLDNKKFRVRQLGDSSSKPRNEPVHWEIVKDDQEMQTRSFRHDDEDGMIRGDLSPRNLVRSLSAPVSGTSFGKLLLEDRHILTGAHIRRKHEALENVTMGTKKRKKDKITIKERVSNFRYFTLRGKLFGKKMQSMMELHHFGEAPMKDTASGPSVVMNIEERRIMENSTEVPPSPASVCSSSPEELLKPLEYLSPISTPDVSPGEESAMSQAFRDISSNLHELRRQLNQLESGESEDTTTTTTTDEKEHGEPEIVDIDDKAEAYVRDLLVASGLYDGSTHKYLSKWNGNSRPISSSVFEEVEEAFRKLVKDDETTIRDGEDKKADHRMLFDLLNETLSSALGPPTNMSQFRKKISGTSMMQPLIGRRLLDCVWKIMCEYLYPSNDESHLPIESMVARNLESTSWFSLIDDEVNGLCKDVECSITGELIDETIKDIRS